MLLAELVDTSRAVAAQASRRAKIDGIAALLRALPADETAIGVAYLSGATLQGRSGIGYALVRVARSQPPAPAPTLTLATLNASLAAIITSTGRGSATLRRDRLAAVFAAATVAEQDFLVRLLMGELRQGAQAGLMVDAVAAAAGVPVDTVRRAATLGGGIVAIAAAALAGGANALAGHVITLFQPVAPMLAKPADDIADAMTRVEQPAIEWKLDGARIQVHKDGDVVRVYSRTGNEVTAAVPEVVEAVRAAAARALVLDGEAIALKPGGAPLAFQDTMSRFGRVLDIDAQRAARPLTPFFFDCLRRDDDDLTGLPASARIAALHAVLPAALCVPRIVTRNVAEAQAFYADALERGHEGVMVKAQPSAYDPGARSADWLKVKRSHTLDLVVLAAEWGHGRRRGWLSNLHLGARDDDGSFVMLGKTFKGMTDATLAWQTEALLALANDRNDWIVHVRPELVVEVAFNDVQASPRYVGGLALRFARIKGYRADKRASDADTLATVRAIFAGQQRE